jgi:glycosyltransferase involved in cell wall biosynthesis
MTKMPQPVTQALCCLRGGCRLCQATNGNEPVARSIVSVITASRNAQLSIAATIDSVIAQTFHGVEHIVVDGASTDGTVDVLRRYDEKIALWTSESDQGVYDAMNKGIALAAGEWIYFLGADDQLHDSNVLGCLFSHPEELKDVDVLFGDVMYDDGRIFRSRMGLSMLIRNSIHHQGAFYRRKLFESFRYSTQHAAVADYELNLRLYQSGGRFLRRDLIVARCGARGLSDKPCLRNYVQEIKLRRRSISWWRSLPFDAFSIFRFVQKAVRRCIRT